MTNDSELTPMMKQYYAAKEAAQGAILLFRMGDFYEMFNEDAYKAAKTLNITVTTRDRNKENPMPMAGFPWQHLESYMARLVAAGHRVAVCDQMEDPKKAKTIVKREITRIVTPGTMMDESMLDPRSCNYLASIFVSETRQTQKGRKTKSCSSCSNVNAVLLDSEQSKATDDLSSNSGELAGSASGKVDGVSGFEDDRCVGLAWVELSTGRFFATTSTFGDLFDNLARINPSECLIQEEVRRAFPEWLLERTTLTQRPGWVFSRQTALETLLKHFGLTTLEGFGFKAETDDIFALQAAGAALDYVLETQKQSLDFIDVLTPYRSESYLEIDEATRRSLEIVQTYRDGRRDGSLLATIDRCSTSMGSRLLADWVACPLKDITKIELRQDAVEELISRESELNSIREAFRSVSDLERLISRIVQERGTPRELSSIGKTLKNLPIFKGFLETSTSALLQSLGRRLALQTELCEELENAFQDNLSLNYRDGGFVKEGYSQELDDLHDKERGGKIWLAEYQRKEILRTGIQNLRVSYTNVFGYYIECTKSAVSSGKIPEDYERKQTLKNAERYTTPVLKQYAQEALEAKEKALELEMEIFATLQRRVAAECVAIQRAAQVLAHLDVLMALASLASANNYCRPRMVDEPVLAIKDGRHPSLDLNCAGGAFVPNDSVCSQEKGFLHLITGPNMAGKSTYIRQTALLVLLAQIGSFIPASEATIGIVDRIFARVGASDELTRGQSTFMVEMIETARILNNATRSSLVILDEIGRGTSTYDGVALAWAIAEHIAKKIQCRTFFATHYHELTDLADVYPGVTNLNVVVREWRDEIAFLHKIEEGAADKSYGVHVAKLAGIPKEVVARAQEILTGLEDAQVTATTDLLRQTLRDLSTSKRQKKEPVIQFSLFGPEDHPVVDELRKLDIETLSPVEALLILERWKKLLADPSSDK